MLAAAVGAGDEDSVVGQAPGNGGRNGRSAKADVLDVAQMFGGESRRVEQAGDEVGRTATERHTVGFHQIDRLTGVPDIAEIDRRTLDDWDQKRAEHADEVADGKRGELPPPARW